MPSRVDSPTSNEPRHASLFRVVNRYVGNLERQVVIELAGGVVEAIYRGELRKQKVLAFATRHCRMNTDRERAAAVLRDLNR